MEALNHQWRAGLAFAVNGPSTAAKELLPSMEAFKPSSMESEAWSFRRQMDNEGFWTIINGEQGLELSTSMEALRPSTAALEFSLSMEAFKPSTMESEA